MTSADEDASDTSTIDSLLPVPLTDMGESAHTRRCQPAERHIMVLLCALCGLLNYADRVNMSVCIISIGAHYKYTVSEQGFIQSAFFWGYVPSQFAAALLCRRIGAKRVLAFGAAGWSLFTALTPVAASAGMPVLLACRVGMGLTEGVAFPA
eukprot:IDg18030t1